MAMQKIDPSTVAAQRNAEAYAKARGAKPGEPSTAATATPPPGPGDRAVISERARDLVDLRSAVDRGRSALANLPDVRQDRLDSVRARLASGYYQSVEVREKVAGKLLNVIQDLENL